MPRKFRPLIEAADGTLLIPGTRGVTGIVDAIDRDAVEGHSWSSATGRDHRTAYLQTSINRKLVKLHRLIGVRMGLDPNADFDHRNNLGWDCRRLNLREATPVQNMWNVGVRRDNKSGVKGVGWNAAKGHWRARIAVNRRTIYLGVFTTCEAATRARRAAELKYHGEFARH